MAKFIGDITLLAELFVLSIGLFVLYMARTKRDQFLQWSGLVLVVGGLILFINTAFTHLRYSLTGEYATVGVSKGGSEEIRFEGPDRRRVWTHQGRRGGRQIFKTYRHQGMSMRGEESASPETEMTNESNSKDQSEK